IILTTIDDNVTVNFGLIGTIGGAGTVRDIGNVNVYIMDIGARSVSGGTEIIGGNVVGGLAGINNGVIINAFATGNPNGPVPQGSPFNGTNFGGVFFPSVPAAVSGRALVGGLVGSNQGVIVNSHAAVSVFGQQAVGGLAGSADNGNNATTSPFFP